jgi:hypothetical protein
MKFAWTLQLPWQLPVHWASQLADGGVALQVTSHWLVQLALHWPMQSVVPLIEEHIPLHDASQLALQLPEQLTIPGLAVHSPMHIVSQLPVQVALAEPEHIAVTLAVQLTGVHCAVHPPDVSNVQDRLVAPAKSIPPHAAMGAAWAVFGVKESAKSVTAAAIADRYGR